MGLIQSVEVLIEKRLPFLAEKETLPAITFVFKL